MGRRRGEPVDLTVVAVPFYFGAWPSSILAPAPGRRAGTDRRRLRAPRHRASLAMGVGSLVAPLVVPGCSVRSPRAGAATARSLVAAAAAPQPSPRWPTSWPVGARPTTRRRRQGPTRTTQPTTAGRRRRARRRQRRRGPPGGLGRRGGRRRRRRGGGHHGVGRRPPPRSGCGAAGCSRPRNRAAGRGRGHRRLGFHLLLEPPLHAREPVHVGRARRAPLERALQPVHRAAPTGGRCPRDLPALRRRCACWASPPTLVATARGVNLLYQFWIHTETIGRLGPPEAVLNTPSHHRVHHGSNRQYLDRNHGGILIVWDRLFGTFEPEGDPSSTA